MQASMMRAGTGARPDKIDATHAFSRSPLSRPYRPFAGPIFNGSNGSRLCENSCACSRGPILFAFSSPQSIQKQENREEFRSARPAAENCRVFAQPRSKLRVRCSRPEPALRADSGRTTVALRTLAFRPFTDLQWTPKTPFYGNYFRTSLF